MSNIDIITVCHVCNAHSSKLLLCSKCKGIRYCSLACQKQDWPEHKLVCGNGPRDNILRAKSVTKFLIKDEGFSKLLMAISHYRVTNSMGKYLVCFVEEKEEDQYDCTVGFSDDDGFSEGNPIPNSNSYLLFYTNKNLKDEDRPAKTIISIDDISCKDAYNKMKSLIPFGEMENKLIIRVNKYKWERMIIIGDKMIVLFKK